ncbi:MAG: diguanylate cyclase [Hydrogenothermaceae bacterium]
MTASFGVTQAKKSDEYYSIFERADEALYKAKNAGKNRVETLI